MKNIFENGLFTKIYYIILKEAVSGNVLPQQYLRFIAITLNADRSWTIEKTYGNSRNFHSRGVKI